DGPRRRGNPRGRRRRGHRAEDDRAVLPGGRRGGDGGVERPAGQVRGRAVQPGDAGGGRGAGALGGGHGGRRRRDGRGGRGVRPGGQDDARLDGRRGVPGVRRGHAVRGAGGGGREVRVFTTKAQRAQRSQ